MTPTLDAPERDLAVLENNAVARSKTSKPSDTLIIPQGWKTLAKKFYFDNLQVNRLKKATDDVRGDLFSAMADSDVAEFSFQTRNEAGKVIGIQAVLETPQRDAIDVTKLLTLVPVEQLLPILSVSKTDVIALCGNKIATQCTYPVDGKENVKIGLVK